ncbi:MAG: hypothetical protein PHF24_00525 [Syntrophomonas sp.]|nr:hypothetical protein [Syntrophomonas sp.]
MSEIKLKLRFDYQGKAKTGKLFGNKNVEQMAEETRQQQVSLLRNVPVQGVRIEDIEMSQEVYAVIDELNGKKLAYAPVIITFYADSIEDAIKFSMKEEFRTIEIIEPDELVLSKNDIEKLLYKVSTELVAYKDYLLRKMDTWK